MTLFVVIINSITLYSETVQSIHDTLEGAENEARELEANLPAGFFCFVENFELNSEDDYYHED